MTESLNRKINEILKGGFLPSLSVGEVHKIDALKPEIDSDNLKDILNTAFSIGYHRHLNDFTSSFKREYFDTIAKKNDLYPLDPHFINDGQNNALVGFTFGVPYLLKKTPYLSSHF